MTQKIENTKIETRNILAPGSRYMDQNVIYYGDKKLITFDTYNKKEYTKTGNEKIMVLTKGVEFRPDLVSFDVYGFPDNWWRILEVNGIKDIWEFRAGKTIFLPDKVL
jgi:hypothetical protein